MTNWRGAIRETPQLPSIGAVLLLIDLALIAAHLAFGRVPPGEHGPTSAWNLAAEWGVGETVEYAKTLLCAGLAASLAARSRQPAFALFSLLYVAAFADNAFQLHERLGDELARFDLTDHSAQFLLLSGFAAVMLALVARAIRRTRGEYRAGALLLLALFALLAFFSVLLDWRHVPVVLEDGGELGTLSLHLLALRLLAARYGARPVEQPHRRLVRNPSAAA